MGARRSGQKGGLVVVASMAIWDRNEAPRGVTGVVRWPGRTWRRLGLEWCGSTREVDWRDETGVRRGGLGHLRRLDGGGEEWRLGLGLSAVETMEESEMQRKWKMVARENKVIGGASLWVSEGGGWICDSRGWVHMVGQLSWGDS
ncbi:unnamed protein product [Sphenostylis stenocarpa]|uniref:Uncharacterized protein n=1 Tax=Sphenostylis stenocarpa TaxID=92480 RepID=A0AA86S219_9FABA|nr:unnamed protein product [Sphenostylis stenocarpa]